MAILDKCADPSAICIKYLCTRDCEYRNCTQHCPQCRQRYHLELLTVEAVRKRVMDSTTWRSHKVLRKTKDIPLLHSMLRCINMRSLLGLIPQHRATSSPRVSILKSVHIHAEVSASSSYRGLPSLGFFSITPGKNLSHSMSIKWRTMSMN